MAFNKKNWLARKAEFLGRRKLVPTGEDNTYYVQRYEGEVSQEGDAFTADNMNDLENRLKQALDDMQEVVDKIDADKVASVVAAAEQAIGDSQAMLESLQEIYDLIKDTDIGDLSNKINDVSSDLAGHTGNTTVHITANERTIWNNKVDKVDGKVLSANDYTTAEKNKLAGIEAGANKTTVTNNLTTTTTGTALDAAQGKILDEKKLDLSGGTMTGNLAVAGVYPATNAGYDLGTTARRWNTLYTGAVERRGSSLQLRSDTGNVYLMGAATSCVNYDNSSFVACRASVFTISSDIRKKENIENIPQEQSFSILESVTPISYEYKSNPGKHHRGFSAQEVEAAVKENDLPEQIYEYDQEQDEYYLNLSELIPDLVNCVKVLKKEVEELRGLIGSE